MKNLFIPYELAVIAKEKGFNEPCLAFYDHFKSLNLLGQTYAGGQNIVEFEKHNSVEYKFSAPLYQQIIDWFREEKDTIVSVFIGRDQHVNSLMDNRVFFPEIIIKGNNQIQKKSYYSYYEALTEAITEAFKLI